MNNNYNKIFVEIIQDKLGTYFANVSQNGSSVNGIAKNVDYKTLKESIREKTNGFIILQRKYLIWQKFSGRKTAYIQNYKNDDVSKDEGVDCRMVWVKGKLEHYKRKVNSMENMENKELSKKFNKVKRLLSKTDDEKTLVDGFWFNQKAIELISYSNRNYFMNSCYNLTVADILNMILYNKNVKEVKAELYDEYGEEYAFAWYDNFKQVLESI